MFLKGRTEPDGASPTKFSAENYRVPFKNIISQKPLPQNYLIFRYVPHHTSPNIQTDIFAKVFLLIQKRDMWQVSRLEAQSAQIPIPPKYVSERITLQD